MTDQTDDANSNRHIVKYLEYYCDAKHEFDYAVLITGPWGVGKTYLTKRFLEARASETARHLFVSLYGITSFRQIEESFYRQLHPVLSSKGMKVVTAVAKGALKLGLKVDLDGDGKDDLTINSQLPELDLAGYLTTPKECVLVFDDLERCSLPISDVLGYINWLVENDGFRTIILANETEILKRPDHRYSEIKEKLIGQTLEVRSSISSALMNFLQTIQDTKTKEYLSQNTATIILLHKEFAAENLRILKHALWDFERLASCFASNHWANETAIDLLLSLMLALSFETRAGFLKKDEFPNLGVNRVVRYMRAKGGVDESTAGRIEKKYPSVNLDQTVIDFDLLRALLFEGWVDPIAIRANLDQSHYYAAPGSEPPWLTAWRGWELTDDKYKAAVTAVEKQFRRRDFPNFGVMLHIFGLRLFFSEIGAIKSSKIEVVRQCIACLDKLEKTGRIDEINTEELWRAGLSVEGRGVTLAETSEFREIFDHYEGIVQRVKERNLPEHGRELLELLKKDATEYGRMLMINNVTASPFYNVPILATIPVVDFVNVVIKLDPTAQSTAFSTFKGRYERGSLKQELANELSWLKLVKTTFEERAKKMAPLSKFRFTNLVGHNIDPLLTGK